MFRSCFATFWLLDPKSILVFRRRKQRGILDPTSPIQLHVQIMLRKTLAAGSQISRSLCALPQPQRGTDFFLTGRRSDSVMYCIRIQL
jgi:hypothetical protein